MRLQVGKFIIRHFKNKIFRETFKIAPYLLIQAARFHAVERSQIGIQQNLLPA